jgi:ribonuclease HI
MENVSATPAGSSFGFADIEELALSLPQSQRAALAIRLLASAPGFLHTMGEALAAESRRSPEPAQIQRERSYTLEVDASYHMKPNVAGIGIVIHTNQKSHGPSEIIDRIAELYAGIPPSMPEKFAILRALEIASERKYQVINVCSDLNHFRESLELHTTGNGVPTNSGFTRDPVHGLILEYTKQFHAVRFPLHPRNKNQEAHKLARYAVRELKPKPCPAIFVPRGNLRSRASLRAITSAS